MNKDYGFVDYSPRDHEIVDYDLYELPDVSGLKFRGPKPQLISGEYFTCIGASQALGVLIDAPFPALLSERLDMPVLNLGLGGVSPSFFAEHDGLIDYINQGKFAVLQVMTARTEENSRLQPTEKIEVLFDRKVGDYVNSIQAWDRIYEDEPERFPQYVAESRSSWVSANLKLLAKIKVPVILFWFSSREEEADLDYNLSKGSEIIGDFPQLVDLQSLEAVKSLCTDYVTCRSDRDRRFKLISRFTGEPVSIDYDKNNRGKIGRIETVNKYYASQLMNNDAAEDLLLAIYRLCEVS